MRFFPRRGYCFAFTAQSKDELDTLKEARSSEAAGRLFPLKLEVTISGALTAAVKSVIHSFRKIYIVINNVISEQLRLSSSRSIRYFLDVFETV